MATDSEYENIYDDVIGSFGGSRESVIDAGDAAMDWLDNYYTSPKEATLLSTHLSDLLAEDSEYMLKAQAESRKAREDRGYLESGFTEGMGTVAAIDNAFGVALSDTYAEIFNLAEQHQADTEQYASVYEFAMKAMLAQDDLTTKERQYEIATNLLDLYQEDKLEQMERGFEYEELLQKQQHENDMELLHLKHANDLANRVIRNKSGLQSYYLEAYSNIIGSDILQSDKYDQLVGLGKQIDAATKQTVDQQFMKVGDNPFDISYIDYLGSYDQGSRTDEAFVWSTADAKHEYIEVMKILSDIIYQIYEQTSHQQREMFNLWGVVKEGLFAELQTMDQNSKIFKDKMEYFNQNKRAFFGSDPNNDQMTDFFYTMYKLTDQSDPAFLVKAESPEIVCIDDGLDCYTPPGNTTWIEWENGQVVDKEMETDGDDRYYEVIYHAYDICLANEGVCGEPPKGYQPPNIRCPWPMTINRDGRCVEDYG